MYIKFIYIMALNRPSSILMYNISVNRSKEQIAKAAVSALKPVT